MSLSFVGTVASKVAHFSTVKIGIVDGTRLISISSLSLEVLVFSSFPSLVSSLSPVGVGSAKIHCDWLVIHAGWHIECVILWSLLPSVVGIIAPIKESASLLIV